jgi:hypothetical protein
MLGAFAITPDGTERLLAVGSADRSPRPIWSLLPDDLKARGLLQAELQRLLDLLAHRNERETPRG